MEQMKAKILIVDDEEGILMTLSHLLQTYFSDIHTAQNGKEALTIIEKEKDLACVLSDIKMPVMNGIELIKNVRKANNNIPFIFFTGFGTDQLMMEALKYGAFDFVAKPNFDQLETIIKNAIESNFQSKDSNEADDSFMTDYQKLLSK